MLSKNKIKYLQSLSRKKVREKEQVFLVEGDKMVLEAIALKDRVSLVCATENFIAENNSLSDLDIEIITCSHEELKKASQLQNPQNALAVVKMQERSFEIATFEKELVIALDFVQDPGNLGTIIRIADWFGIDQIICSEDTVDCYNPKVIQASMGAMFRVKLNYMNLPEAISKAQSMATPVYGTFMEGENIYQSELSKNGILVLGNEGNGISPEVEKLVNQKIHIPSFNSSENGSESLNVATAAAICCSEFKRRLQ